MPNKYTIHDVEKVLGRELTEGLLDIVTEDDAIDWFYKSNERFDSLSPCEYTQKYGNEKIQEAIYRLGSGEGA